MSKRPRRNHSSAFEAKVALAAVKGEKTLAELAQQLGISRGSVYYLPRPVSAADLAIMRRIDELHLAYPFAGSRMLRDLRPRGREGRPAARRNADQEDGDRRDLPAAEHVEAGAEAQNLPLPLTNDECPIDQQLAFRCQGRNRTRRLCSWA